jgi:hypothetical protein
MTAGKWPRGCCLVTLAGQMLPSLLTHAKSKTCSTTIVPALWVLLSQASGRFRAKGIRDVGLAGAHSRWP